MITETQLKMVENAIPNCRRISIYTRVMATILDSF
jgi:hypothetical protein